MVDARQQPAVAPLLVVDAGQEAAAQDRAFAFERRQRPGRRARLKSERRRQRRRRDRPEPLEPAAQDLDQRIVARQRLSGLIGGRRDLRFEPRLRPQGLELGQPLGRNPEPRLRREQKGDASLPRQRVEPFPPRGRGASLGFGQRPQPQQGVMQFLGVDRIRPGFGLNPGDGLGIEPAKVGRVLGIAPAPGHHRLGPPLFQRRVVEEGVRFCVQRLEGEGRGLGQVARNDADVACLEAREQPLQAVDVHRLVQAVADRLIGERMVGDLAFADQILGAGDLIGEDRGDQVLSLHPQELRRHLLAGAKSRQRQRNAGDPAPSGGEHRRVEHRLDEHRADTVRMQIAGHVAKLEAVRGGQREYDVVFRRRGLQFEVEFAAEALAQRQAPGSIDPAAEGGVDDELHAARFIEEPLEYDRVLCRQTAERREGCGKVVDELQRRLSTQANLVDQPALRRRARAVGAQPRGDFSAQTRDGG